MNAACKYDIVSNGHEDRVVDELFQDECMIKTLCDVSVSDLMSIDHSVWIKRNSKFGFDIEIQNDEEMFESFQEKGAHPYAVESFAEFCRRFLHSYSRLMDKEIA